MSMMPLSGLKILITRPIQQATVLAKQIESLGGTAIVFPCLEIIDVENEATLKEQIQQLHSADMAIFISPNAALKSAELIKDHLEHLTIVSMGEGTSRVLNDHGISVDVQPTSDFTSEGLLSLPEFEHLNNKMIVIFKGRGGRDLLINTLTKRGANVVEIDCYERIKPDADSSSLIEQWRQNGIDVVICTSGEGLSNLCTLLGDSVELLQQSHLLIGSKRLSPLANDLGLMNNTLISTNASDRAIIDTLIAWNAHENR